MAALTTLVLTGFGTGPSKSLTHRVLTSEAFELEGRPVDTLHDRLGSWPKTHQREVRLRASFGRAANAPIASGRRHSRPPCWWWAPSGEEQSAATT